MRSSLRMYREDKHRFLWGMRCADDHGPCVKRRKSSVDDTQFRCLACSAMFQSSFQLTKHGSGEHSKLSFSVDSLKYPTLTYRDVYECQLCDCTFMSEHNFDVHITEEHPEYVAGVRWRCSICPPEARKFLRKHYLERHMYSVHELGWNQERVVAKVDPKSDKLPPYEDLYAKAQPEWIDLRNDAFTVSNSVNTSVVGGPTFQSTFLDMNLVIKEESESKCNQLENTSAPMPSTQCALERPIKEEPIDGGLPLTENIIKQEESKLSTENLPLQHVIKEEAEEPIYGDNVLNYITNNVCEQLSVIKKEEPDIEEVLVVEHSVNVRKTKNMNKVVSKKGRKRTKRMVKKPIIAKPTQRKDVLSTLKPNLWLTIADYYDREFSRM